MKYKVIVYYDVRVSTTSQVDEGYSIDEQKAKLTSYCTDELVIG